MEFATCDTKSNAHRTVNVAFFATHTNPRINGTLSQGEHAIFLFVFDSEVRTGAGGLKYSLANT